MGSILKLGSPSISSRKKKNTRIHESSLPYSSDKTAETEIQLPSSRGSDSNNAQRPTKTATDSIISYQMEKFLKKNKQHLGHKR